MNDKCCRTCKYYKDGYCLNTYELKTDFDYENYKGIFETELKETGLLEESVRESLNEGVFVRTKILFERYLETFSRLSRKARMRISNKMIEMFKEDEDEVFENVSDRILEVTANILEEHKRVQGRYVSIVNPDEFYCSAWE